MRKSSLLSHIREKMEVVTIDGACLGSVTFLHEPDKIGVSGHKEFVSAKWVAWVDGSVYLSKTHQQVMAIWNSKKTRPRSSNLPETTERQAAPLD